MAFVVKSSRKTIKKNSREIIKLKDINETWGALKHASKVIRAGLPMRIIFHDDPFFIAFHSLGSFSFGKRKYKIDDRESVEKQCANILGKYGIYSN